MGTRRTFLHQIGAGLSVAGLGVAQTGAARLGCQTNAWTINPHDFSTLLGVLGKLKGYGYAGFETGFANVQDQFNDAAEAKRKLEDSGLQFFGVHIFLNQYDPQTLIAPVDLYRKIADGGAKLGAQRLILSGAPASDKAALARKSAALNEAGKYAKNAGLRLCYHNHWPEFEKGAAEIEGLVAATDPALVSFVIDAGHAVRAKADVPDFLRRHSTRLDGMHLRDFKGDEQVPLGSGTFPLAPLAASIRSSRWMGWLLNEEERPNFKPGDTAVAPARATLVKYFGGTV